MHAVQSNREKHLREKCHATDDEIAQINSIVQLKKQYFNRPVSSNDQPSEILDSWLFQGDWKHATNPVLLDSLSITHILNVTDQILLDQSRQILHIPSENGRSANLTESFHQSNEFLDRCRTNNRRVLVHCERGVSRSSTIILAYLMYHKMWTVSQAFEYLLTKRQQASPNWVLLLQLIRSENK